MCQLTRYIHTAMDTMCTITRLLQPHAWQHSSPTSSPCIPALSQPSERFTQPLAGMWHSDLQHFYQSGAKPRRQWGEWVKATLLPSLTHDSPPPLLPHSLTWPRASCPASRIPPPTAWLRSEFCQMGLWRTRGPWTPFSSGCYSLLQSVDSLGDSFLHVYVTANTAANRSLCGGVPQGRTFGPF